MIASIPAPIAAAKGTTSSANKVGPALFDDGQLLVGVGRGRAVTGEVFADGQDATLLQPGDDRQGVGDHLVRCPPPGSAELADDGVVRVEVRVEHRGHRHVDADGRHLLAHHPTVGKEGRRAVGETCGRGVRQGREPADRVEALDEPALLVGGDQHPDPVCRFGLPL
jgi:hypothetical protein